MPRLSCTTLHYPCDAIIPAHFDQLLSTPPILYMASPAPDAKPAIANFKDRGFEITKDLEVEDGEARH
ncbi:hypothetical protein ACFX19_046346 [Malus domestica]